MGADIAVAAIAALGALLAVWVAQRLNVRSERERVRVDRRLSAGAEILAAIPDISRRLTNYMYLEPEEKNNRENTIIKEFHHIAIKWNAALAQGLAVLLPHQSSYLLEMDREVDRLLDLANETQWRRMDFRGERKRLGELAVLLINDLRVSADLGRIETPSIWNWADEYAKEQA